MTCHVRLHTSFNVQISIPIHLNHLYPSLYLCCFNEWRLQWNWISFMRIYYYSFILSIYIMAFDNNKRICNSFIRAFIPLFFYSWEFMVWLDDVNCAKWRLASTVISVRYFAIEIVRIMSRPTIPGNTIILLSLDCWLSIQKAFASTINKIQKLFIVHVSIELMEMIDLQWEHNFLLIECVIQCFWLVGMPTKPTCSLNSTTIKQPPSNKFCNLMNVDIPVSAAPRSISISHPTTFHFEHQITQILGIETSLHEAFAFGINNRSVARFINHRKLRRTNQKKKKNIVVFGTHINLFVHDVGKSVFSPKWYVRRKAYAFWPTKNTLHIQNRATSHRHTDRQLTDGETPPDAIRNERCTQNKMRRRRLCATYHRQIIPPNARYH